MRTVCIKIESFCLESKGCFDAQGMEKKMLMTVIGILILCIWLFVIPIWVGELFVGADRLAGRLPFRLINGQLCLWGGFQLLCVPLVLAQKDYRFLVRLFLAYTVVLLLGAAVLFLRRRKRPALYVVREHSFKERKVETAAWILFWVLLLFQLVQAVVMTYADGDDAYYVAVSSITENAGTMYRKLPYTGGTTELDARHGLAPFPIWIAFLASMSGIRTVSVAHVAVPVALIAMTYGIFYLIGEKLFAKRRECVPVFLIFTQLLVLFGDTSFYTVENFMIARSRQGKAALGSIIIPALFLLLLLLLEKIQEKEKIPPGFWVLLGAAMTAACLCSTMGALLVCMLMGITGICAAVCFRKWSVLLPMGCCCIPCVGFAVLYLLL